MNGSFEGHPNHKRSTNRPTGYTFIEVLVAVMVLGIVMLAATPRLSGADSARLELAASEVAAAVRFARSEAMRTGEVHAIFIDEANEQVTVEKTDLSTKPASTESILYHPIAKQPYDFNITKNVATRDVVVDNAAAPFLFPTAGKQRRLMFDAAGVPVFIDTVVSSTYLLSSAEVKLAQGQLGLGVVVHPFTGRVTIE
jgi:prepilin-type N-terminal cleavage/methylation domain-containing protein